MEDNPNWVALATIHIPYKRFIKASKPDDSQSENILENNEIVTNCSGVEIREFYESMIQGQSNKKEFVRVNRNSDISSKNIKTKDETKIEFDRNKFFRSAMNNDVKILKSFKYNKKIINSTDQYGWSALMMASCENSIDAVKFLISEGIDKNIQDKKGNTALTLAKAKGFKHIIKLLEDYKYALTTKKKDIRKNVTKHETFQYFCTICDKEFNVKCKKDHETSTVHLFNLKNEKKNILRYSTISNDNRGLKLMIRQGWDRASGLGPTGSGKLYPIKTVLRKTRSGLGIEQPPPKVTHFKPYDLNAIKYKAPERTKTKNEMHKEKRKNQKKERRLRNELS